MSAERSPSESSVRLAVTPTDRYGRSDFHGASSVATAADMRRAQNFVERLPGYHRTPLLEDEALSAECRVAAVWIKHEGHRQPTKSFKVLGPPYALARQLLARLDRPESDLSLLVRGELAESISHMTATAATSGNHGRALAWAARTFGCQCRISIPDSTGAFREQEIRRFGAETVRVPGNYDDAVHQAVRDSTERGFVLVGDGARSNHVIRHIIHGYAMVGTELATEVSSGGKISHVFVPAGSGALAAAVTAGLWSALGESRPRVVVVQPHEADSGYQSCLQGERVASKGNLSTLMDGLSVRELAEDAWSILKTGAFAFLAIDDQTARRTLARLTRNGKQLTIGETGIAALAGFEAAARSSQVRERLGLDDESRVVVVATEGVTDPHVAQAILNDA